MKYTVLHCNIDIIHLSILNETNLIITSVLLLISTIIFIALTFYYLDLKRSKFLYKENLQKILNDWVGHILIHHAEKNEEFENIQKALKKIVKNKASHQFIISELIKLKKSFAGDAALRIVQLYEELQLLKVSLKKIQSKKWHLIAQGIQELHQMNQIQYIPLLESFADHTNEFIRNESQVGLINLKGMQGLLFLNHSKQILTDWHQMKLLNQMSNIAFEDMGNMHDWLQSKNNSVIVFALRIVEVYQLHHFYNQVKKCLHHHNDKVTKQAILTIIKISNENTVFDMFEIFPQKNIASKILILDSVKIISTEKHKTIYKPLLRSENEDVRIKALQLLNLAS